MQSYETIDKNSIVPLHYSQNTQISNLDLFRQGTNRFLHVSFHGKHHLALACIGFVCLNLRD